MTLLAVRDLRTHFFTADGIVRAVDGVSFDLAPRETLGIVGEFGLRQVGDRALDPAADRARDRPHRLRLDPLRRAGDHVALERGDARLRGNKIAMIFQEPMTSLNPVLTIGTQIGESVVRHMGLPWRTALDRAREMLDLVRIADARRCLDQYPHQLSGGMRQRVMIAIALACNPQVLIADEPTTALDVTIQAQILDLMLELKEKLDTAIILITHDLGVVAETCDRAIVMYAGRIAEEATVTELFARPLHPYSRGLQRALPGVDAEGTNLRPRLAEIPGIVPALNRPIAGCAFAPRCELATERCRATPPVLTQFGAGHQVACWEADRVGPPHERARQPRSAEPDQAFPGPRRLAVPPQGDGEGGRRREFLDPPRRNARAGRRVRVRQDDGQPDGAETARADRGPHPAQWRGRHHALSRADVGAPTQRPDRVPGSLFVAQSAPLGRRDRRRAALELRYRARA